MLRVSLVRLMEIMGAEGGLAMVRRHGGLEYRMPKTRRGRRYHELEAEVGPGPAAALMRVYAGDRLYVAKDDSLDAARRDAVIRAAYDVRSRTGERNVVKSLAREHDLSERWVWAILGSPAPEVDPTLDLFDQA